ncbi:hypothetical protein [Zhongshania marina]|uniref:hypothetical protein n=1 Tax=Zhongshania marina TaxID=2304603 RepID=UPI0011AEC40E|nr:hypothetical protein [Marortus luteolus]
MRNKDNRTVHESAKLTAVSALVHNFIMKAGQGYSGQISIWLRRLMRNTKLMTYGEQKEFAKELVKNEIEDINANPWGYCLLKTRTRERAKCATGGEPQRHNAAPDICLGCANNLMQEDNSDWNLLHIQAHVEALRNPDVPKSFKLASYDIVSKVARHVRAINPAHEALNEIDELINNFERVQYNVEVF